MLKRYSGQKFFCLVFSQKNLPDLKTDITKFLLSKTLRSQDITDLRLDFTVEILPELPIRNKILKSYVLHVPDQLWEDYEFYTSYKFIVSHFLNS